MNNIIIILFNYWKNILTTYKEFKHLCIFSATNSNSYNLFKNYIRNYLSNYKGGEKRKYLDHFFINTLYRYKYEKDALILRNMVQLPNVNNSINKLCIRRLNSDLYKWYLYSLSKINSYNLINTLFEHSIKKYNIKIFSSLRILSIVSKKHNNIIVDLINNYVDAIVDNIAIISIIDDNVYKEYIINILSFYIFRGDKNKPLKVYSIYKTKNIPSQIKRYCEYSIRYKYARYLLCNHGIVAP